MLNALSKSAFISPTGPSKFTRVRPVPSKASSPMDLTHLGIVTLVRPVQLRNARSPIAVTVFPPSTEGIVSIPLGAGETAAVPMPPPPSFHISAVPPLIRYVHV